MAESLRQKMLGNSVSRAVNEALGNIECAVCLQSCVHPAELPCGHIFCYLCIKGIVTQGRRCAMCRQSIPVDYLEKPKLLKPVDLESLNQGFDDGHLWFYEGHNGWWQYDERTSLELETAYQKKERCCELLIAGYLYIADFDAMLQYRRNDPSKRRRIKRDLATTMKKGIAGLKATKDCSVLSTVSNVYSEDIIQRAPVVGLPTMDNINDTAVNSSDDNSYNFNEHNTESELDGNRHLPISSSTAYSVNSVSNTNSNSPVRDDYTYSRNFDIDNLICRTLDCTIEEIESLNLELLNDYEVLYRRVNNPNTVCNNMNRRRLVRNYMGQFLNSENRLNNSLMDEVDSSQRPRLFSQSNQPNQPSRNQPSQSIENIEQENPTQLPIQNREETRMESQQSFPRRSTSLTKETLF